MTSHRRRLLALIAAGTLASPVLVACGEDERTSTSQVIVPGGPGEAAETLPPGSTFAPEEEPLTEADVAFVSGMIPHHEQALLLAGLASERAEHEQVLGLASRIEDVQGAEIAVYERWLDERGLARDGRPSGQRGTGDDHGDHGDVSLDGEAPMRGMASEAEIARLRDLRGGDFDRLWLELMVAHHEGALTMAEERLTSGGVDVRADEMADDVVVTQHSEINRMLAILADQPG